MQTYFDNLAYYYYLVYSLSHIKIPEFLLIDSIMQNYTLLNTLDPILTRDLIFNYYSEPNFQFPPVFSDIPIFF